MLNAPTWSWLCDPDTFVDGQVWPWEVEFLPDENGPGDFRPGVHNAHTGPFMSFAGILGEIEEGRYRDLWYFYGSYALSFKLFRPTRFGSGWRITPPAPVWHSKSMPTSDHGRPLSGPG